MSMRFEEQPLSTNKTFDLAKTTGIRQVVLEEICQFAQKYQLDKVLLFGSRARGDYRERSDIDLAISGGKTALFTVDVQEYTSTLLKYDIVSLDAPMQPELLSSILKEGKLLYEKI